MEIAMTKWDVTELVYSWFRKITAKAPVEELLSMLSSEGLEMKFPEETLKSYDDFKRWYSTVTHQFFNQVHEVKMLDVDVSGDKAAVKLIVNWQAETWNPPQPFSKREGFYVHQTWSVKKDQKTGKPVIATYLVEEFDPMLGMQPLPG
jgi:hypothetical protein